VNTACVVCVAHFKKSLNNLAHHYIVILVPLSTHGITLLACYARSPARTHARIPAYLHARTRPAEAAAHAHARACRQPSRQNLKRSQTTLILHAFLPIQP
jgi:hypothetical protein